MSHTPQATPGVRAVGLLAMATIVLVVAATGCTARHGTRGSAPAPTRARAESTPSPVPEDPRGPATFVSVRAEPDDSQAALVVSDARTGQPLRRLHTLPWDGMNVAGTAIDRGGQIWVTLNRGPTCTSDVAGCGPEPHTCASRVIEIEPTTGRTRAVLSGGDDELISDAQPSPDDRRLAYLHSDCARSYFTDALVVRPLDGGRTVIIGSGLAPCHDLADPRWTADGTHLSVVYGATGPESGPAVSGEGYGICSASAPPGLVLVDAARPQAGMVGPTVAADPNCPMASAAPTATGFAAVESCGSGVVGAPDQRLLLVTFGPGLARRSASPLGTCGDGTELAVDASGHHLLIASYQYCPGGSAVPVTRLLTATAIGPAPTLVATAPGGFEQFASPSW
jgi:hypothetical protein